MRVAVVSAVYNEEKHIGRMIENLLAQTRMPEEVILVDDGSTDGTARVIEEYAKRYSLIRLIRNSNQGPAASRNIAWRAAQTDIAIFTDGDCVPDRDWIEKLMKHFISDDIAAVAGTYRTLNEDHILARFVGHEIAWRYRDVCGAVDAHGAYNLAIRKSVLEEMNGFEESYKAPSGEDWDLTYRISRKYKILFAPDAIVAHAHPEAFWPYMKNQARRGFDRIKLYNDHPDKRSGDVYTGGIAKYQVLAAGLLPFALFLLPFRGFRVLPIVLLLFLLGSCRNVFGFVFKRDSAAAFYGVGVQFVRCFAWAWGAMKGVLRFGFKLEKSNRDLDVKKEHWDRFWSAGSSARFTRKSWSKVRIMEVLDSVVSEGMEVLDAGCGSGFFSAYFLSKGCRVWALDHSDASLEIARKSTQGRCQAYLKEDLFRDDWTGPFRNKFDLIFSDGLFEHFSEEDQRRLMNHFRMLKKENGIIATFVPNRYSWWEVVRPLVMPGIQEVPFTSSKLIKLHSDMRLLKTGGLNVLPLRVSPERTLGSRIGMILYCLATA